MGVEDQQQRRDTGSGDAVAGGSVHYRTCPLCEATCGLEVTVRDGRVARIRGDRDDVFSHGFICPKGSTLKQLHEDPDRLRRPVVRRGDPADPTAWEEVDWQEAYAEVERRLVPIIEQHGRDAVAIYLGNPNAHHLAGALYARPLIRSLGTRNVFSASTVDQMPKHVSAGLMFGGPLLIPVPDLDRTDFLLMLGANPLESNGSLCTAPDFPGRLEAILARGGRIVVVDPRRTKTAALAGEHLRIRPGTDAHLLLALAHVLVDEELVTLGPLADHTEGLERVPELVAPFTPERVAPVTGIAATTIRDLARDLAAAPRAAVYGRIGTHTVSFGTLASWGVDLLNALTGNLDRPGGAMFPLPAHTATGTGGPGRGYSTGRWASRVREYPEVNSEFPVATLADEIFEPGEGQIRALITVGGNPVLSTPDAGRLDKALGALELVVSVDPYRNETTRHADVILPPPSPLTRSQYDLAFTALSVRNVANWSPPLFEPDGPPEHEILAKLSLIAAGQGADADPAIVDELLLHGVAERASEEQRGGLSVDEVKAAVDGPGRAPTDKVLDVMLRTGAYGDRFGARPDGLSLAVLQANPHGIDLGPLEPRVPEVLRTRSGKVELAPAPIADDVARLVADLDRDRTGEVLLVGRRHLRSNNSWMHNVRVLVKGRERCTLLVHPDDAARLGLADGATATVRSRVGSLVAPVEVSDEVMAGVVSLPHGWGHDLPGVELSVAGERPGVNSNVLTDADVLDPLSGNAALNAIPVEVSPVVS
ncbi:MAG: molybdopterin oxidoreductase family protein [Acidimicrobiales bacterium]|jgi:anaerobic selenocysteine-containing dehydrogenase|nr:molybdopterin oxidoreductase family protein [Acidimicrobiales bacterium]